VTMLTFNRLDRRDRTALVAQIAGGKALPDEVVAQIANRTDGVPLFVEEMTKSVLESGVTPLGIPTSLHGSLMARLDRLGPMRRVAQIGAAIGREFPYALLRSVSRLPEDELLAALTRLVALELVLQRGAPPDAVYSFKHALVQDAAHDSLLRTTRQQLHAQIAEALETQSPELIDSQPELLAQHYAEAGIGKKSVAYWARPVIAPPPALQWRKRLRNSRRGWISWCYCRTRPNASGRSSNFVARWARHCDSSKGRPRWKRAKRMLARESCGSSSAFQRSTFIFPMGNLAITCTTARPIWRCTWTRICCKSAVNATIPAGSFWLTNPAVQATDSEVGLPYRDHLWKQFFRYTTQIPTMRWALRPEATPRS